MHINNCGISFVHPKTFCIDRPNGSGDYLFVMTQSPAIFIVNGKTKRLPEGVVILYKKDEPQHFMAAGGLYKNAFIHFCLDADDETFISKLPLVYGEPFQNLNTTQFMTLQHTVWETFIDQRIYRDDLILHLMRAFLISLSREMAAKPIVYPGGEIKEAIEKLHMEIVRDISKSWNVEDMAKSVNLSPSYFQSLYKQIYGRSCIEDVIFYKLEYAKYLLTATDYSINIIASLCGYSSLIHFSRQFKSRIGMTATEYRKDKSNDMN